MPKNNALDILNYPAFNLTNVDILYSKEEQKYRFNQFTDLTDSRGEFSAARRMQFLTEPNGYIRPLNPNNLNYSKSTIEHKKFRHYSNNVLLRKNVSGDQNFVLALGIQKHLNSPR